MYVKGRNAECRKQKVRFKTSLKLRPNLHRPIAHFNSLVQPNNEAV